MDGGMIINLKYIAGLYVMITLGFARLCEGSVECISKECKIAEEVVSIYGPTFDTPVSREPYFIKINRCVMTNDMSISESDPECWSNRIRKKSIKVEIVVPDLNNKGKFYKYVVYNDTACTCNGTGHEKPHLNITYNEINETEFKKKLQNNPVNIRSCKQGYCNKPQPRYLINQNDHAHPTNKYILFYQCLPGCNSTTRFSNESYTGGDYKSYKVQVRNDTACSPYLQEGATAKIREASRSRSTNHNSQQASNATVSQNGTIIIIDSAKLLLAAFVLSVILLLILLVDCNLYYRKKGILYSMMCFKKHRPETDCENCDERRRNNITDV